MYKLIRADGLLRGPVAEDLMRKKVSMSRLPACVVEGAMPLVAAVPVEKRRGWCVFTRVGGLREVMMTWRFRMGPGMGVGVLGG